MKTAVFTPEAFNDVERTFNYFEGQRQGLGIKFLTRVDKTIEGIESVPEGSQVIVADVRRAPILRQFKDYAPWYRDRQNDVW